ncbi:putative RNA methyltransferase [Streptomyces sp. NPDC003077]|uniref:putative RNA methyltransferase n=1 Tax=Streptomyces sp. NPDC003077 TaxID=3154443 RepID=UPI0033AF5295
MSHTPPAAADAPWTRQLEVLSCPLCGERLTLADRALRCPARHAFDVAKQGYVGLLTGNMRAGSADTAAMVQARTDFLEGGHYAPLARTLAEVASGACPPDGNVLDAGTGTGYYLAAVLDALPQAAGLGLDVSKFALRRAARAHTRACAATWDLWQPLPVRTGSVDLVLNVFAPRNGAEFRRVLRPGGALVVATPAAAHLKELRDALGLGMLSVDAAKDERLHRTLDEHFRRERAEACAYEVELGAEDVVNVVGMGPSAHHVDGEELRRRVDALGLPLRVGVSFLVSVYRPR